MDWERRGFKDLNHHFIQWRRHDKTLWGWLTEPPEGYKDILMLYPGWDLASVENAEQDGNIRLPKNWTF